MKVINGDNAGVIAINLQVPSSGAIRSPRRRSVIKDGKTDRDDGSRYLEVWVGRIAQSDCYWRDIDRSNQGSKIRGDHRVVLNNHYARRCFLITKIVAYEPGAGNVLQHFTVY